MSSGYSNPQPIEVTAGAAIKLGFFAALGATLFSLALSIVAVVIAVVLALIFGTSMFALFNS